MDFLSLLLMSLGLAMDATAVSAARGLAVAHVSFGKSLRMALIFGAFHIAMPLIGWGIGAWIDTWVQAYAHWIAFLILSGLGGKMIYEALSPEDSQDDKPTRDPFRLSVILPLAVGISIDALAVGFTLPLLGASLPLALTLMGLVTAILTMFGVYTGRYFGAMFGRRLDIAGGVVLIVIGLKLLIEHFRR